MGLEGRTLTTDRSWLVRFTRASRLWRLHVARGHRVLGLVSPPRIFLFSDPGYKSQIGQAVIPTVQHRLRGADQAKGSAGLGWAACIMVMSSSSLRPQKKHLQPWSLLLLLPLLVMEDGDAPPSAPPDGSARYVRLAFRAAS